MVSIVSQQVGGSDDETRKEAAMEIKIWVASFVKNKAKSIWRRI